MVYQLGCQRVIIQFHYKFQRNKLTTLIRMQNRMMFYNTTGYMSYVLNSNMLTTSQKNKILNTLEWECECRGTDATGIAYNLSGRMKIYKRPLPAHKLRLRIPNNVQVVMEHTHMTT